MNLKGTNHHQHKKNQSSSTKKDPITIYQKGPITINLKGTNHYQPKMDQLLNLKGTNHYQPKRDQSLST